MKAIIEKNLPQYLPPLNLWDSISGQLDRLETQDKDLKEHIARLPQYQPPLYLWDTISDELDTSQEKDALLKKKLAQLPQYEPRIGLWDDISTELNHLAKQDDVLKQQLANLPNYNPPQSLWNGVETELGQPVKVFRLPNWQRYAIAATLLGCILTFGTLFYQNATSVGNEKITLAYSEEKLDTTPIIEDWDEDEAAFAKVEEICQQQTFLCEQPEVKTLKSELDELNEAKQSLKTALGQYGNDETIVAELVQVEKERSEVLKKIMDKI
jgi:hypothetical protein